MPESVAGGKYLLERELARGGMGTIWLAFDPQLQRKVVLKKMLRGGHVADETRAQFEREAQAIAQLQSSHVVQVFDYGIEPDGSPYIVMELLDGETLDERLERQKKLGLPQLVEIVNQVARGLGAAHVAGIAHRDLKPANIFICRGDGGETLKILDFGLASTIARDGKAGAPLRNNLCGTPLFMSPEQIDHDEADHRADLWALAVICYRALAGDFPFPPALLPEMFARIRHEAHPPPSRRAPDLRPGVDAFFDRALAKNPAARFQSVREFAGAFSALLDLGAEGRTARILVVDDEPDLAALMQQRFRHQIQKSVFSFVFAHDGASGLAQLKAHPDIDLVLSDINMPGMDGLTFLSRVGEVDPIVKVVVVSAYGDMKNIRTAMNRGAFDFLIKPISFKDLEAVIVKTVKHVRAVRRAVRFTEENSILRMFVGEGIVDRLLPMIRATQGADTESFDGTVAMLGVCDARCIAADTGHDATIRHLNANFELILPEVTARDGAIHGFRGDAAVVVFRGDDHVLRALDACVAARDRVLVAAAHGGPGSPYRGGVAIGIETGRVGSGGVGSKALGRFDYTVLGDVVRRAARGQQAAGANEIVIGDAVHSAAVPLYECEEVIGDAMPPAARRIVARRREPFFGVVPDARSALAETVSLGSASDLMAEVAERRELDASQP